MVLDILLATLAVAGWGMAAMLLYRRPTKPGDPTHIVLLNASGMPESIRALRGELLRTYYRPSGKGRATPYRRKCTAIVFSAEPVQ